MPQPDEPHQPRRVPNSEADRLRGAPNLEADHLRGAPDFEVDRLRGALNADADHLHGVPTPDADHLRGVLNAEADRHQPDRAAMLARITEARNASARGRLARIVAGLMRPAAAATAVAGVLVVGVAGAQVIDYTQNRPDTPAAAPTPSPSPSSASPSSAAASSRPHASSSAVSPPRPATTRPHPSSPATSKPSTKAPVTPPGSFLTATAALDPASFDNWAQSNLVLATTETITALDVTIRIAATGKPTDPGRWTSIPTEIVDMSVKPTGGGWSYRFILKKNQTLAPGRYTFAAQYNHAPGSRDLSHDTYSAKAGTADDKAKVSGRF
jgi:hypothetical protein